MRSTGWDRMAAACHSEKSQVAAGPLLGGSEAGLPEGGKANSPRWFLIGWGLALIWFSTVLGCQREGKPSGAEVDRAETNGVGEVERWVPESPGGGEGNAVDRSDGARRSGVGSGEASTGSGVTGGDDIEERPRRAPPAAVFRHPLDEVPEGKLYREVLQAMDEGNLRPAQEFLSTFSEHPQFGVLAQAVRGQLLADSPGDRGRRRCGLPSRFRPCRSCERSP
jgi:hypothetical protein